MARRSVLLVFYLFCGLCSDCIPSVLTAKRNLWLDCPCIHATEVNENNRGVFSVNSSNPRFVRSDCVLIFVMGTTSNIVQLKLKDVQLQPNCVEYVELFPYLKEPVIENTTIPEYTMCHSHFKRNVLLNYAPEELNEIVSQLDANEAEMADDEHEHHGIGGQNHRQPHQQLQEELFSGGRIYGLRVIFKPASLRRNDSVAVYIRGEYAFLDRANFENDGRLIQGTYCDYYFFAEEQNAVANETNEVWKYFHSPRYPANYAAHIQCTYKFIGSCNLDKVTIYDAESPNVSSIIDVICETVHNKRIYSTGPDLLIEFNASSNQTAKGFRGKFKFVNATKLKKNKIAASSSSSSSPSVIANPKLNEVLFQESPLPPIPPPKSHHAILATNMPTTGSGSSSPLVNPMAMRPEDSSLNVAKEARRLVHQSNWASVATISSDPSNAGHPMVNLLPTADGKNGEIFFYVLDIAVVAKDVKKENKISFMFSDAQKAESNEKWADPWSLECQRAVILGQVKKVEKGSDEYNCGMKAFSSRHPAAANWQRQPIPNSPIHDYYLCKLEISDVQAVTEFGFKHASAKQYYAGSD